MLIYIEKSNCGVSPSGKAADFDSATRRFESSHPSLICNKLHGGIINTRYFFIKDTKCYYYGCNPIYSRC